MMDITLGTQRYVVQWEHVDDEQRTQEFIKEHKPVASNYVPRPGNPNVKDYKGNVPLKAHRYNGMTICRIKIPIPKQADGRTLETRFEGYAFRLTGEPIFDKAMARRSSLAHALKGQLTEADRRAIWIKFNSIWPPMKAEMSRWQKRYLAVSMQNAALFAQLQARPRDSVPGDVNRTLGDGDTGSLG